MSLQPYERFKGITDWRRDDLNDNLEYGILSWTRWSMLQIGAFENVSVAQASGLYGGHPSILRPVNDPYTQEGTVWEAIRSDWVWETGISYGVQPTVCSGVYVNGDFIDSSSLAYIDYTRGRIVLNSGINITSDVRCDYSFRIPTVSYSKEPYMQELLYGSLDVSRSDFMTANSGSHNQLAQCRRQMPTIGIELSDRKGYKPFQLGGGQFVYQDVIFYIFAEKKHERDKLINIISNQNDISIYIPNIALMKESSQFPVDVDLKGIPVNNRKQYPEIIAPTGDGGFRWTSSRLTNAHGQSLQKTNDWLYRGSVRFTCESIFQNI